MGIRDDFHVKKYLLHSSCIVADAAMMQMRIILLWNHGWQVSAGALEPRNMVATTLRRRRINRFIDRVCVAARARFDCPRSEALVGVSPPLTQRIIFTVDPSTHSSAAGVRGTRGLASVPRITATKFHIRLFNSPLKR